ncbi:nucleotide disphospho-sugar-binding domain-containing protein [Georgenia sp. Z1491]|uniref:nucleotide disphospho-sugar-binding domain-containing protein n=1 Tax=Georgenia sp. Z1491 TaxID=3416707 RepID=UPI003CE7E772
MPVDPRRTDRADYLFATWDGGGNQVPATAIAHELRARGHRVRFLGLATQADAFHAKDLEFSPYPTAGGFTVGASPAALLRLIANRAMGRDVVADLRSRPADVVVVDAVLFGVMDELRRAGRGYAVLGHTFDGFLRRSLRTGGPLLRLQGLRPLDLLDSSLTTMVASVPELDAGHGDVVHIGPVVRGEPARPPEPLVLVSLSTFGFRGLVPTWQRVLDAVDGLDVRVVATTGPALDPSALRVPGNVEVHRWLPHADILPRASVVIGHGGHGTTMAALAHGVPLLVLPLDPMSDQPVVGHAIARAGVGATLPRTTSPEDIRAAVSRLLAAGPHRAAAADLGERVRRLDGRTGGADLLESIAGRPPVAGAARSRAGRPRGGRDLPRVTAAVGVDQVPTSTMSRTGIDAPDYADEFTLDMPGADTATAETWARAMLGDVPSLAERFIFQVLLRLRLARTATDETVAGFAIAERTGERVLLEADSPLLRCRLLVQVREHSVSLTTVMGYHRRRGRITWTLVSAVHRRLGPGLLREAAAKVGLPAPKG